MRIGTASSSITFPGCHITIGPGRNGSYARKVKRVLPASGKPSLGNEYPSSMGLQQTRADPAEVRCPCRAPVTWPGVTAVNHPIKRRDFRFGALPQRADNGHMHEAG